MYFENIFFLDYFLALKIPNFDVPCVNIYTTTSPHSTNITLSLSPSGKNWISFTIFTLKSQNYKSCQNLDCIRFPKWTHYFVYKQDISASLKSSCLRAIGLYLAKARSWLLPMVWLCNQPFLCKFARWTNYGFILVLYVCLYSLHFYWSWD